MRQRGSEYLLDLTGFGNWREGFTNPRDDGCDCKAGYCFMAGQSPQHVNILRRQPDFFPCLSQGCGGHIRVAFVLLSTGKSDLPRVMLERRRPLGQVNLSSEPGFGNRDQNTRRSEGPTRW